MDDLTKLSEMNSSRVNISSLGKTFEGRDLTLVTVTSRREDQGDDSAAKPIIFLNCGIHAREWIAPAVCVWMVIGITNSIIDSIH